MGLRMGATIAVLAVMTVACRDRDAALVDPAVDAAESAAALDRDWAWRMQDTVKKHLRDPDSAAFRDVVTHHGAGMPVACGEVNSNNGLGGKAGFQRFVAAGEMAFLEEDMAPGEMDSTWAKLCID